MRLSQHQFVNCSISVVPAEVPDPDNPEQTIHLKSLRIENPEQGETYFFTMTEELRKEVLRQLSGGVVHVAMAIPKERIH